MSREKLDCLGENLHWLKLMCIVRNTESNKVKSVLLMEQRLQFIYLCIYLGVSFYLSPT